MTKRNYLLLFAGLFLLSVSSFANAGKFYFTLGNSLDGGGFNSAEFSLSTGGGYTSTVDLGGTFYFNQVDGGNVNLLSFDAFSSLEGVQESGFLFAAGARIFLLEAKHEGEGEDRENKLDSTLSYGVAAGMDLGYQFATGIPTVLLWTFDYSPDLLTGGKLEEFIQSAILYEIKFNPIVIGHISYRFGDGEYEVPVPERISRFENSIGLGIKVRF